MTVQEIIECDVDRLYGPLDEAVLYLQEVRAEFPGTNISLEENWTGYEDMEMRFVYLRDETPGELRIKAECKRREKLRYARERENIHERERLDAEIKKLKKRRDRI